jgi:MSHA biogenesis protein MshK
MVGGLMGANFIRYTLVVLFSAWLLPASVGFAQALRDPTRPPGSGAKGMPDRSGKSGWLLQSVLISPERRYAIINGEVVPLGGSVSGAELVAVAAERVTLRTPDGLRIVHLFPDVTRLGSPQPGGPAKQPTAEEERQLTPRHRAEPPGTKQ